MRRLTGELLAAGTTREAKTLLHRRYQFPTARSRTGRELWLYRSYHPGYPTFLLPQPKSAVAKLLGEGSAECTAASDGAAAGFADMVALQQ